MSNLLLHGLGQNGRSWTEVLTLLQARGMDARCPDLFGLTEPGARTYPALYRAFADFCLAQPGRLNLCGLSLGGVLALDFAKAHPEKMNTLILIGTPFKIPRLLFKIQGLIFRLSPESAFAPLGLSKGDFLDLMRSMANLNIAQNLESIPCPALILCGERDRVNLRYAKSLNQRIPSSRFQTVTGASHQVNLDNPRALSELIFEFWNDSRP